jgi:hypothetical protein
VPHEGAHAQRLYKSNLFADYFSDRGRLIEAYGALTGSEVAPDAAIEFETLENVLYVGGYNDIAFTVEGRYVVLVEHQSTLNENMPLRFLLYMARVYERTVESDALYRRALRKVPTPEFIVVYNGRGPYPDKKVLRLSDAFVGETEKPALELVATVHNIAAGHSRVTLSRSRALSDYAAFVSAVEGRRAAGLSLDEAVTEAVRECRRRGIMAPYLESRGSEVLGMLLTEWNMEDALRVRGEEEREIGLAEGERRGEMRGRELGERQAARSHAARMKSDGLDAALIARYTGLAPDEVAGL